MVIFAKENKTTLYSAAITLKNGSVVKGVITDLPMNGTVNLQTEDGSTFIIKSSDILRIERMMYKRESKEKNTSYYNPQVAFIKPLETSGIPPVVDSWYTMWGGHYFIPSYPDNLAGLTTPIDDLAFGRGEFTSNLAFGGDLFGLYLPYSDNHVMLGTVVNAQFDRYSSRSNSLEFLQGMISFSTLYFSEEYFREGLFVRGDIGISTLIISSNTVQNLPTNAFGGGALIAGGYVLDIGYRSHLLIQGSLSYRRINGANITLSSFGLNWLF